MGHQGTNAKANQVMETVEWTTDPDYLLQQYRLATDSADFDDEGNTLRRSPTGIEYFLNTPLYSALIVASPSFNPRQEWNCHLWAIPHQPGTLTDMVLPLSVIQASEEPHATTVISPHLTRERGEHYDSYLLEGYLPNSIANVLNSLKQAVNHYVAASQTRLISSLAEQLSFHAVKPIRGGTCYVYSGVWYDEVVSFKVETTQASLKRTETTRYGRSFHEEVLFNGTAFSMNPKRSVQISVETVKATLERSSDNNFFAWMSDPNIQRPYPLPPEELAVIFSLASYDYGFFTYTDAGKYRLAAPYRFPNRATKLFA